MVAGPGLRRTDVWQRHVKEVEGGWEVMADYQSWCCSAGCTRVARCTRAITELWENHFNVPVNSDAACHLARRLRRRHPRRALGRFDDLLHAVVTHPAMLINLDNVSSTDSSPTRTSGASCSSCTRSVAASTTRTT